MTQTELAVVILAAGKGTRMKSARPKVLHEIAGRPMLGYIIAASKAAGASRIVVVTSEDAEEVRAYAAAEGAGSAVQEPQLGTGHAVACARDVLGRFAGTLVAIYGDTPLLTAGTIRASAEAALRGKRIAIVAFRANDPTPYGRLIVKSNGLLDRIIEAKDATPEQRKIDLCNAGILSGEAGDVFRFAAALENDNVQKEYYLSDIPVLANGEGIGCAVVTTDEAEVMGVNSRAELAAAEAAMQVRLRTAAMEAGAGLIDPSTVHLSYDTILEPDVAVAPFVVFGRGVTVKRGAEIRSFCHLEGAVVGEGARVGPFARLRPGAMLEEDVHIGNFVEVKKTRLEKGAKANHLAYLGDARVGAGANIGAGTITCNYDGFDKHFTDIGAGAFIGSNTALVAPVKVGDGAYVGAGSAVAKDVSRDALAVVRAEQREIAGWADKFRTRKKAEKAAKRQNKSKGR